ncbi:MAG TPA: hypothetical protein VE959_32760 [Bryobacteraceae bacterium]|nr:hypothetical protein [Bryobacteraceae bacterium]
MQLRKTVLLALPLLCLVPVARAQFAQQGNKLVGSGGVNQGGSNNGIGQGSSVALSADGNTAIVGALLDNGWLGAAWVFTRTGGVWSQQGIKLVGTGALGAIVHQGASVAISGDGNTAIVGGWGDNGNTGAAWVFTRFNGLWSQQGNKLTGTGAVGATIYQGAAVSLSGDGNTAIVGGPGDNASFGAAWVYTRVNGVWLQQGSKLVGTGAVSSPLAPFQGFSVSLSSDGNTAIVGAPEDNNNTGAAWVFTRTGGVWSQQGNKLTGSGAVGSVPAEQGYSVAISGDGNTAMSGGIYDNSGQGAIWAFTRSSGAWSQQGNKLVGNGVATLAQQGGSVALSSDGNTAIWGGLQDNSQFGAAWAFKRLNGTWIQQGNKLVGSGGVGNPQQGAVALSGDGLTALVGGYVDNGGTGATWVFAQVPAGPATHFSVTVPSSVSAGTPFNFTVTALDNNNNVATAYTGTVHFDSTDISAVRPLNTTLVNGTGTFTATLNTAGNQTITAVDINNVAINGISNAITVTSAVGTAPTGVGPGSGSGFSQIMTFNFTDPRGYQDLDVVNVLINNFLDGRNACYLAYSRTASVLYLVPDAGGGLLPGLVLNGAGSTSNSQCAVTGSGSSAVGNGTTLTLTLNLTFSASFAGNKVVYTAARDLEGGNSGWQPLGTWAVPGAATFPSVGGVSPSRGANSNQTFTFTFTDTKGFQDFGVVNVLINNFLDGRQACYLAYSRPAGVLYLVNDAGGTLLPGLALNGTGSVNNSQCTVTGAGSAASGSGNNLTLTLNLSFSAAFDGNRVIYAAARDSTDANSSNWQAVGSWTVQ